jgi:diguanylate cyclase (GGDEF)-like protein/PAS domain S-box-containing protein
MCDAREPGGNDLEAAAVRLHLRGALIHRSPARLLVLTVFAIAAVEMVVMVVLGQLPPLPGWADNVMDALLLVVFVCPILYFLIFRPFIIHLDGVHLRDEALQQSEARLRLIVDSAADAIVRSDSAGCVIGWNEQAETIFGWRADEALGRKVSELIVPPRYRAQHDRGMGLFVATGQGGRLNRRFETTALHRSGREFAVELAIAPVKLAEGYIFSAFIHDISERKLIEENLQLAAKVFQSSGEGIIITDHRNVIISVNPAFTSITGYAAEEVIGQNPRRLKSGRHDRAFYRAMWASIHGTGGWQGEIWNRRKNGEAFVEWLSITCTRGQSGEVTHYIATFSDITARKAAAERIEHMAHHDQLTGLPNRTLLKDRLDQALSGARRHGRKVAVFFLDLDGFKAINDGLGHAAGDVVLKAVADRLKASVRSEDTVSRLGGDEFVIVLTDVRDDGAAEAAGKVIAAVSQPFDIDGQPVNTATSVGIAVFPDDGQDAAELIKAADAAMYRAKEAGRGIFRFHTPQRRSAPDTEPALPNEDGHGAGMTAGGGISAT